MPPKNDSLPLHETNGAISTETPDSDLPDVDAPSNTATGTGDTSKDSSVARAGKSAHQAHGAVMTGPISSVQQLIGRRSVAKGSMGSFGTLEDYRDHIDTLSLGELHAHAIDSMETPIYETSILKTRLERKWTEVNARTTPGRGPGQSRGGPGGYTPEQNAKAQALLKKMLSGKRN